MLQWSTKLSHTTSARSDNSNSRLTIAPSLMWAQCDLKYSIYSDSLALALFALLSWLFILLDIPLPIVALLTPRWMSTRLVFPALSGQVKIRAPNTLYYQQTRACIKHCHTGYAFWVVIITLTSGQRFLIWRDACDESSYRHLLATIKSGHLQCDRRSRS